ncbi:uncharacterized protein LOC115624165 [Scaptodrosophila lebanonensis]|uniref:Uncharacterized protein LOC115624165 n=1 Tax=Drosophila lebanonensis TaxID=7225 RepID=A0A6J2THN1_DROLE|nr:uncharacterized protein LOC115624165 [Scaptodrosophila lebanonensis]
MAQTTKDKTELDVPHWLCRSFFEQFLRRDFENFEKISKLEVLPTGGNGENYTTVLLRVRLEIQLKDGKQATTSYMAKILPASPTSQQLVQSWKVFDKEHNTYSNYLPEFEQMFRDAGKEITFGAKYYKIQNSGLENEAVILEDLGNSGFRNIKRQDGMDKEHTQATLEKLAQFHAASAVRYERKGEYPDLYDRNLLNGEDTAEFQEKLAKSLISCLPLYEATHLANVLKEYTAVAPDMYQSYAPRRENEFCVLNHGDAWCNNIMFQYDDNGRIRDTYLVDFQMSRYCSPAQDLIYLLLSSVNYDIKVDKFHYFIQYYHEKLTESLKLLQYPKPLPSLKGLHKAIFDNSEWVYPVISLLLPVVLMDSSEEANMDTIMDNDSNADFRKTMLRTPRIINQLKTLLPWAHNLGFFEASSVSPYRK